MVSAGFTFENIEHMTLAQISAYVQSIHKQRNIERLNTISAIRIAHHADSDDYSRVIDEIKRDI